MQFRSNGWRFDMKYISFNDIQQYSTNRNRTLWQYDIVTTYFTKDKQINLNLPGEEGGGGNPTNNLSIPPFKYNGIQILNIQSTVEHISAHFDFARHVSISLYFGKKKPLKLKKLQF